MNLIKLDMPQKSCNKSLLELSTVANMLCLVFLFMINTPLVKAQKTTESDNPIIREFKVSTVRVKGENWQQISWFTTGADKVQLLKDDKNIPGRVQLKDGTIGWPSSMKGLKMRLRKDAKFELIVENNLGVTTNKIINFKTSVKSETEKTGGLKTKLKNYPRIKSFYITPKKVTKGGDIKFHWNVKDANKIKLYDDIGEIDLRSDHQRNAGLTSFFSTTIDKTTRFKLVAFDGKKKPAAKTFTVVVTKPKNKGRCSVSGQLSGKWRQQLRETPKGPLSTWIVNLYISERNSNRPFAKATVSKSGRYLMSNLEKAKNYTIKPDWNANPKQVNFSCNNNKSQSVINFKITGGPRMD